MGNPNTSPWFKKTRNDAAFKIKPPPDRKVSTLSKTFTPVDLKGMLCIFAALKEKHINDCIYFDGLLIIRF